MKLLNTLINIQHSLSGQQTGMNPASGTHPMHEGSTWMWGFHGWGLVFWIFLAMLLVVIVTLLLRRR